MNNKGQTLVIFVILMPILVLTFATIIDLGFSYIEKRNISNNTYDATKYYLDNINNSDVKEKTIKLLEKNINDSKINIDDSKEYVLITVKKERKISFNFIKNNVIDIKYKGYKENKKIIKG